MEKRENADNQRMKFMSWSNKFLDMDNLMDNLIVISSLSDNNQTSQMM